MDDHTIPEDLDALLERLNAQLDALVLPRAPTRPSFSFRK
jgi:hypothetical protein